MRIRSRIFGRALLGRLASFALFSCGLLALNRGALGAPAAAKPTGTHPKGFAPSLSLANVKIYEPSSDPDIAALWIGPDAVFSVPAMGHDLLRSAYDPHGKDFMSAFHLKSRLDIPATRLPLWPEERTAKFRGLFSPSPAILVALDGFEARLYAYDLTRKAVVDKGEIALDLLKPPRDARGEPTARETAAFRTRFASALRIDMDRPRTAGVAKAPAWLAREDGAKQMMVTNIKGFPLVTLRCSAEGWTQCMLVRACFVGLPADAKGHEWSGIAYSPKRDLILIANRTAHRLDAYRGKSCYAIRHVGSIALDPKIKPLRSVQVDQDDNLWISTELSDDYLNASLLRWDAKQW